ncbi:MAG TPA: ABC transporter ATP-binding protein [Bacillota bacterium]|nr:ABC transporter ATP-binding protein [Bacillota bacterium]
MTENRINNQRKGLVRLSDEEEYQSQTFNRHLLVRLLGYLKPYRMQITQMVILALLAIIAALTLPYLLKIGIDRYICQRDWLGLLKLSLVYIGMAGVQYVCLLGQGLLMITLGQKAIFDLRHDLFTHIQSLDLGFFDRQKAGRIIIRVTNDVNSLEELLSSGVSTAFADTFTLIGLLIVMFWMDWRLSLVIFLTVPIIIWVAVFLRNKLMEASRAIRYRLSIVNSNLNESLMGIRVTQAFGREAVNGELFREINRDHFLATLKFIPLNAFFWPWIGFLNTVGMAAVMLMGGFLSFYGWVTLGSIAAFTNYINRFFQPIQNLSNLVNVISTAMASCERIFELMDLEPAVVEPDNPQPLGEIKGEVRFEKVKFGYNPQEIVLQDFNLDVKPGEVIALVGPTGAGKSTVINLLCRFYDPVAGRVLIDGQDLQGLSQTDYKRQIAIVLQDTFIFSGTVAENIRYGKPEARPEEIYAAAQRVGIHDYICSLPAQYQTRVQERGSSLSVGQRQLIAFARALIRDPKILILDEATSSIDTQTEQQLQQALQEILPGRTAFIIAHRLSTIRKADRIIVIDQGQIAEVGNHRELLRAGGIYAKLCESQYRIE